MSMINASTPRDDVPPPLRDDARAARLASIDAALADVRSASDWFGAPLPPPAAVPGYPLHIGSYDYAFDGAALETLGVTHVLRLHSRGMQEPPPEVLWPRARRAVVLHSWEVDDEEGVPLLNTVHTAAALRYIHGALADGHRVLITCYAGLNRSVTLATAYVALTHERRGDAVADVLASIARQRTWALSNASFRLALAALDTASWRAYLGWDSGTTSSSSPSVREARRSTAHSSTASGARSPRRPPPPKLRRLADAAVEAPHGDAAVSMPVAARGEGSLRLRLFPTGAAAAAADHADPGTKEHREGNVAAPTVPPARVGAHGGGGSGVDAVAAALDGSQGGERSARGLGVDRRL